MKQLTEKQQQAIERKAMEDEQHRLKRLLQGKKKRKDNRAKKEED